jgi:hypothetical protein
MTYGVRRSCRRFNGVLGATKVPVAENLVRALLEFLPKIKRGELDESTTSKPERSKTDTHTWISIP